jgi:hypothetical protein
MKLTNYTRDAFITSVMDDVPKIDYHEAYRAAFLEAYIPTLPKVVQDMWASNATRPYLALTSARGCGSSFSVPTNDRYGEIPTPAAATDKLAALVAAHNAQKQARDALRVNLKGAAYGCTTTKALRELLPEFDRYLPAEIEKTSRQLPVVQNIMADFVKAGWPAKKAVKK